MIDGLSAEATFLLEQKFIAKFDDARARNLFHELLHRLFLLLFYFAPSRIKTLALHSTMKGEDN